MIKLKDDNNVNVYEIWNAYTCETIYTDFYPTADELDELSLKVGWITDKKIKMNTLSPYINKIKPFFTRE